MNYPVFILLLVAVASARSIEELSIESNSLDEDTNLETLSEDTTDISGNGCVIYGPGKHQ
jgi:hypothetical protein